MPFVVVDTSVSLPATLSPRGLTRKFWIILALGGLTYEVEHRRLELDALAKEAARMAGSVRGLELALDRITLAEERRAALLELLPYGVPDDWVAVGSAPVFDEYERKPREVGRSSIPSSARATSRSSADRQKQYARPVALRLTRATRLL